MLMSGTKTTRIDPAGHVGGRPPVGTLTARRAMTMATTRSAVRRGRGRSMRAAPGSVRLAATSNRRSRPAESVPPVEQAT